MQFSVARALRSGRFLTAVAAGLILLIGILASPWVELFQLGGPHGPPAAALVGYVVIAAALLDRWRPMRWATMIGGALSTPVLAGIALVKHQPAALLAAALCGTVSMVLGSMPVHRWFHAKRSVWGDDTQSELETAERTALPMEDVRSRLAQLPHAPLGESPEDAVRAERSARDRQLGRLWR